MRTCFLTFAIITVLSSCGLGIDQKELDKDAETLASDRCQTHWINTKIDRVTKHFAQIQDSLKLTSLDEPTKRRLIFYKFKRRDEIDYFKEQQKAYVNNNAEQEAEFKKGKYSSAVAWRKLNEKAEELLKKKGTCDPND